MATITAEGISWRATGGVGAATFIPCSEVVKFQVWWNSPVIIQKKKPAFSGCS